MVTDTIENKLDETIRTPKHYCTLFDGWVITIGSQNTVNTGNKSTQNVDVDKTTEKPYQNNNDLKMLYKPTTIQQDYTA